MRKFMTILAALGALAVAALAGAPAANATTTGKQLGVILPGDTYPTYDPSVEVPADEPVFQPFTSVANCALTLNFYKLINTSNATTCYANAGSLNINVAKVKKICPGNNRGRLLYTLNGETYWSTWRGKDAAGVCYSFPNPVTGKKIEIA